MDEGGRGITDLEQALRGEKTADNEFMTFRSKLNASGKGPKAKLIIVTTIIIIWCLGLGCKAFTRYGTIHNDRKNHEPALVNLV
jgi:hypothetical protein